MRVRFCCSFVSQERDGTLCSRCLPLNLMFFLCSSSLWLVYALLFYSHKAPTHHARKDEAQTIPGFYETCQLDHVINMVINVFSSLFR